MEVNGRAFDSKRTFEHFACLPLLLIPLDSGFGVWVQALTFYEVVFTLISCAIVDEADLFAVYEEFLALRITGALACDLGQLKS